MSESEKLFFPQLLYTIRQLKNFGFIDKSHFCFFQLTLLNNAKKSCFKPFDWTIWSHSQPRSEQKTTKKTHTSSTTSKLLQQRTNNFKAIVSNNEQRAQLFQYLETFRRVWQKPIECYVTCRSVHFSLWSNWTGCPQQHDNIGKVDQCKLRKAL